MRIEPDGEGAIRLDARPWSDATGVDAIGIAFDAREGERYLGFGERSNAVDQRGNSVESFVSDGPYHPEDRPFLQAFVPPPGYQPRDDSTYFPMPWLLSTARLRRAARQRRDEPLPPGQRRPGRLERRGAERRALELRFFAGPQPADVLRRLTDRVGRQPPPAAPWFFGPWFQPRRGTRRLADLDKLAGADVPTSAVNTYLHYLPCGDQVGRRDAERELTSGYHARGAGDHRLLQPDDLQRLPARRSTRRRRAAC